MQCLARTNRGYGDIFEVRKPVDQPSFSMSKFKFTDKLKVDFLECYDKNWPDKSKASKEVGVPLIVIKDHTLFDIDFSRAVEEIEAHHLQAVEITLLKRAKKDTKDTASERLFIARTRLGYQERTKVDLTGQFANVNVQADLRDTDCTKERLLELLEKQTKSLGGGV